MSRHLHLDLVGGLAGDMLVAALVDLGADHGALVEGLQALGLPGWRARTDTVSRGPFQARLFSVELETEDQGEATWRPADVPLGEPETREAHDHSHGHGHDHAHDDGHDHGHSHGHNRNWTDIRALLDAAPLPPRVRARAQAVFAALAQAEGRVHGRPPESVTFHEVGALDSIVDIVGACLALELLDVDAVTAGPVPLSQGSIVSAHGRIPLPAPATTELLCGWPTTPGPAGRELITPTGAALLKALATPDRPPPMTLLRQGYGAGHRNPSDAPNVVRALLGVVDDSAAAPPKEWLVEMRCQVDDLSGEHIPPLLDALFSAGAVDAVVIPVLMKKGRPAFLVEALAHPDASAAVEDALLRHSSTFGLRKTTVARETLDRWHVSVQTAYGAVRVKVGARGGEVIHLSPEFEDVAAAARRAGVPHQAVHQAALRALDPASVTVPETA